MGWDIQINPTAEAHPVSLGLVHLLDGYVEDFEIRYCALNPTTEAIAALRGLRRDSHEDEQVVSALISELEAGNGVELLMRH